VRVWALPPGLVRPSRFSPPRSLDRFSLLAGVESPSLGRFPALPDRGELCLSAEPLGLAVRGCLAAPVASSSGGLTPLHRKVKPEKVKKSPTSNTTRSWLTAKSPLTMRSLARSRTVYGEGNVYLFTSTRKDCADVGTTAPRHGLPPTQSLRPGKPLRNGQDSILPGYGPALTPAAAAGT